MFKEMFVLSDEAGWEGDGGSGKVGLLFSTGAGEEQRDGRRDEAGEEAREVRGDEAGDSSHS